ncbi:hypothetical protein AMK26_23605 [Streptomyces sp. CB03234]|uniref:hypothetical protein n=1 Tax=Streptomyces sp. (strain CB03234) TaxID=1703937 RepID=UPI00093BE3A5|nr:hypothetical protein [Streptomyces sp. CB03234]OKK02602.1 hypothetical protein AMK26_23605 [Streptomyces sp. CB03234]
MAAPRLIIYPPAIAGVRMVTYGGRVLGWAFRLSDIAKLLQAAGAEPDDVCLDDREVCEWRGGGPETWTSA